MSDEEGGYNTRDMTAYAHKLLIKEDISIRVSETINKARFLFYCLSNAPTIKPKTVKKQNISTNTTLTNNIYLSRALQNQQQAGELDDGEVQRRIVSINAFNQFIVEFYGLWMSTKDQIGDNWSKGPNKKTGYIGLKKEIQQFLEDVSYGRCDARTALRIFSDYTSTLSKSGITNIKSYSYKPEEVGRESI